MSSALSSNLFQSIKVGQHTLNHRVVLAPMTRFRSTQKAHVPILPLVGQYYAQRSSRPGTLLISEAALISPIAGGFDNAPGIWNESQIASWKEITKGVHANGSFMFLQLGALGRGAYREILESEGHSYVSASPIPIDEKHGTPRALTEDEIHEYVDLFAQAAKNAMEAGFDGVEIHGANGYFIDQFLQDVSNQRTDKYGGSIENRSRLGLEIVDAVARAIGEERTAFRVSPWNTSMGMHMTDPIPQYTHFISELKAAHPDLAYLHVVEPEAAGRAKDIPESNDFIRQIWSPKPLITAGGYTRETAIARAEQNDNELIAFGKLYISNPDLPTRLAKNIPLSVFNAKTFYPTRDQDGQSSCAGFRLGYIDYPTAEQAENILQGQQPIKV